jgi:hypothetical protein
VSAKTVDDAAVMLKRYRQYLVERGRYEAWCVCRKEGTVHSRQVRDKMKAQGLLNPAVGERWLGAVFYRSELFEPVEGAHHAAAPQSGTNYHGGALVRVWRLTEVGKATTLKCPPWYSVVPQGPLPTPKKRSAANKSAQPAQPAPQGDTHMGITKLKSLRAEAEILGQLREVGWSQEAGAFITSISLDEFYELLEKLKTGTLASVRVPPSAQTAAPAPAKPPVAAAPPSEATIAKADTKPVEAAKPSVSQEIAPTHATAAESDAAEPAAPAPENGPDVFDEAIAALKAQPEGEVPAALLKAGRMLDVVNYFVEKGIKDEAAIVAECERIKDKVPFLARTGNLPSRIQRTLAAYHGNAA